MILLRYVNLSINRYNNIITSEVFAYIASIMYSKISKKELEQECERSGIEHGRLDRKQLMKMLQEHEELEGSEYE